MEFCARNGRSDLQKAAKRQRMSQQSGNSKACSPFKHSCVFYLAIPTAHNQLRTGRGSKEHSDEGLLLVVGLLLVSPCVNTWIKTYLTAGPSLTRGETLKAAEAGF